MARIYKQANGKYKLIWDEPTPDGGFRQRARRFTYKKDAEAFDRERLRRKQLGPAYSMDFGQVTLVQFLASPNWLVVHGDLASASRKRYKWAFEKHLSALLDVPLIEIDVARLMTEQQRMKDAGATLKTRRHVLALLSRVLDVATAAGKIPGNPVKALPSSGRITPNEVKPLAPAELERCCSICAPTPTPRTAPIGRSLAATTSPPCSLAAAVSAPRRSAGCRITPTATPSCISAPPTPRTPAPTRE